MVSPKTDGNYCVTKVNKTDLHIMNKQSIIRNSDKLMELA